MRETPHSVTDTHDSYDELVPILLEETVNAPF